MKDRIDKYIEELVQTVIQASLNYDIWRTYTREGYFEKYVDVMNDYLQFFRTSIHAHFVAMLLALYRLYEKRKDTRNIRGLIDIFKQNMLLQSRIGDIESRYDDAHSIWKKVSILRNEAFGHRSKKFNVEEVFKKANVSPDELMNLIEITKSLLNEIKYLRDRSDLPNINVSEDTVRLLDDLNELRSIRSRRASCQDKTGA